MESQLAGVDQRSKVPWRRRFVFVVAIGRDGSTLLQSLLNIPWSTLVRGENALALELASALSHFSTMHERVLPGGMTFLKRWVRLTRGTHLPWFGFAGISQTRVTRKLRRIILRDVIRPLPHHRLVGFKEIRWSDFPQAVDGLDRLFPEALYLVIEREPREVADSGWWPEVTRAEHEIARRQAYGRRLLEKVGPRGLLVDYHELVTNPEESTKKISSHLGVEISPSKAHQVVARKLSHRGGLPPWQWTSPTAEGQ